RPNGYVDLQYRYYGDTEGQNDGTWHGYSEEDGNNYSRIQLEGKVNMTEKQSLYFRIREWNDLNENEKKHVKGDGTQTRLRYFYDHGNLGDSKVNFTSRIQYQDGSNSLQSVQYQTRFNFAEYMFNNDFIKTTAFILAPTYEYGWAKNDSDYYNGLGLYFLMVNQHPWGFETGIETDSTFMYKFYGQDKTIAANGKTYDENATVGLKVYFAQTTSLYSEGKLSIALYNEGGYNNFNWSEKDIYGTKGDQNTSYSAYWNPEFQFNYQATENVVAYTNLGAEYRNWAEEGRKSATNWRWQPYVTVGFKTTF
ncbi:hypothetical protein, partial [Fusobacterium sp.]